MTEHLSSCEKSCDELETSDLFQTETVDSDETFAKLGGKLDNWVFRGHNGPKFGLKTTLELECGRHNLELYLAPEVEKKFLREFGRRVHLYLKDSSQIPDPGDTLEWISLMRHYGAPTRVLDWTYSIHVAAHFALNSSENNKPCWIWAIEPKKLDAQAETLYPGLREPRGMTQKSGAHFREHFMAPAPNTFVSTATPYRLNERLAIQRGVFLCPGNVTKSFLENLRATGSIKGYAIKILEGYRQSLRNLLLKLNINSEVLFPGLQGLAESLNDRLFQLHGLVENGTIDISCIGRSSGD
jgi:hypothetical protein